MATLQKIRNKAVLLTVIIGLALFAFIIGDFLNSGSSLFRQSQQKIAQIGGTSLDYKDYEARILELQEVYKIQTGQTNLDDAMAGQLRESVFETIVRERLLDEQAEKLGVAVTGKEVYNMINGENIHPIVQQLPIFKNPQTGVFDRTVMMNFLQTIQNDDLSKYPEESQEQIKQLKSYWLFWENNLKYTRLEEKINALLTNAVKANSIDAEFSFNDRSENIDFAYVLKPYSSEPDSLFEVSSRDLKNKYSSEIERFKQKPYRSAKYVVVDVKASQDDYKAIEEKINSLKADFETSTDPGAFANANSDESYYDCYIANSMFPAQVKDFINSNGAGAFMQPTFNEDVYRMAKIISSTVAPDSVKARQIVVENQAKADSIINVLKGGADFAAVAAKHSLNPNGTDMGWFREIDAMQMGKDFVRACFNASVNSVFSVKTKYGVSVLEVTAKSSPVRKSNIALISLKVTPSSRTYGDTYNALNKIVAENQNAEDFFAKAAKEGYEVLTAKYVRKSDLTLGEIPQMRQAVRFVYENDKNTISSVLENSENQLLVVGVTDISDGDYQTVEEVKPLLMAELINNLKAEKIIGKLSSKSITSLQDLAATEGLKVDTAKYVNFSLQRITGLGDEPALLASLAKSEPGKISKPLKGKTGVYVYNVVNKTRSQEKFDPKAEMAGLNSNNMYRLMYQSFEAVKNASKVVDNRIRFY